MELEVQAQFVLRIILAAVSGAMIGYERKSRSKEAGIRTHMIVAIGASLMMVISKYGFLDLVQTYGMNADGSRVAAQIVSGVGFLGAGMIMVRGQLVSGLTTAAGIWATSGVGMAIGAGLYPLGLASAILIVIFQVLLHWQPLHQDQILEHVSITLHNQDGVMRLLLQELKIHDLYIHSCKATKSNNNTLELEMILKVTKEFTSYKIIEIFEDINYVISIDF